MSEVCAETLRRKLAAEDTRHGPILNPEDGIALAAVRPATVWVPSANEWHACVIVDGEDGDREFYVGRDAFATQQDAMAVAVSRARQRMEDADGRG